MAKSCGAPRFIDEEFREILRGSLFIDESRRDALYFALRKRAEMLTDIVNSRTALFHVDNIGADVADNIEYGDEADDEEWER